MAIIHVIGSSIFFYVLLLLNLPTTISISESEALLNLKNSFTNANSLDSWKPGTDPCGKSPHWAGVICSNGVVSSLRLRRLGLSGKIDIDSLLSLSGLRSVGFVSNSFSGPIPDFHRMVLLKGLYLSRNQFSGEIPSDYFSPMQGLKKVWLSGNKFSGRIPSSLFQLPNVMELHLEDNQFSGSIPELEHSTLTFLNVSNNNLEGEIPSSLSKFSDTSFKNNPDLCGDNISKPCDSFFTNPCIKWQTLIWVVSVSSGLFLVMLGGICLLKRRQEKLDRMVDDSSSIRISSVKKTDLAINRNDFGPGHRVGSVRKGSRRFGRGVDIVMVNDEMGEFTLSDLMKASAEVLGNGVLGSSYKAVMRRGMTVVVKRIKEASKITKDEFDGELRRLGSLKHKNVLAPLAYHFRRDEKLLVYNYQPKGSLQFLLHGDHEMSDADLKWGTRLKIIQGIVRGLAYIHTHLSSFDLPHGNIKSSNVLLTEENEPLLTDYGLCSLISSSKAAQSLTAYKAPEAILDQDISPKCDVFFLGVVILEILTGKFPSRYHNAEGGIDIVQWVRSSMSEGKQEELFYPDVERSAECLGQMEQLLQIGAACTECNPNQRLDLAEVVRRIEGVTGEDCFQELEMIHLSEDEKSFRETP
ncbi:hypothetical protein ACS0TY_012676 [Phlomoides rotata]